MYVADRINEKTRKNDRIFVLKQIEGENIKNSSGMIDNRLFQGGNNLHAIKHPQTGLWYFKFEHGVLPEDLRTQFTTFKDIRNHAEAYFKKRGVQIAGVLD